MMRSETTQASQEFKDAFRLAFAMERFAILRQHHEDIHLWSAERQEAVFDRYFEEVRRTNPRVHGWLRAVTTTAREAIMFELMARQLSRRGRR